mmetsp:Transcript_41290/g.95063  ORF Transcript_41290/g.95063 Transcript_41290/m.95063 type:complete len:271 (+) Transcript_41290:2111-2923(+)
MISPFTAMRSKAARALCLSIPCIGRSRATSWEACIARVVAASLSTKATLCKAPRRLFRCDSSPLASLSARPGFMDGARFMEGSRVTRGCSSLDGSLSTLSPVPSSSNSSSYSLPSLGASSFADRSTRPCRASSNKLSAKSSNSRVEFEIVCVRVSISVGANSPRNAGAPSSVKNGAVLPPTAQYPGAVSSALHFRAVGSSQRSTRTRFAVALVGPLRLLRSRGADAGDADAAGAGLRDEGLRLARELTLPAFEVVDLAGELDLEAHGELC